MNSIRRDLLKTGVGIGALISLALLPKGAVPEQKLELKEVPDFKNLHGKILRPEPFQDLADCVAQLQQEITILRSKT